MQCKYKNALSTYELSLIIVISFKSVGGLLISLSAVKEIKGAFKESQAFLTEKCTKWQCDLNNVGRLCHQSCDQWMETEICMKSAVILFRAAKWSPSPWSPAHPSNPASPSRPRCSSSWTTSPTRVTAPLPLTARQTMRTGSLIKVTSCWSTWRTLSFSLPTRRSWLNTTLESRWHSSSTWVTQCRHCISVS